MIRVGLRFSDWIDAARQDGRRGSSSGRPMSQTMGLTAGRVVAAALSLVWMGLLARYLDEAAVSAFSLALSLTVTLSILADLGLPMIVADRVSRYPSEARSLVRRVARSRVAASGATALVVMLMYRIGTTATMAVPILLSVSVTATAIHTTATAALRGLGVVIHDAVNEVVSRVFVLGAGAVALAAGGGAVAAAVVLAIADLGSAVALMAVVVRRTDPGPEVPKELVSWRVVAPLAGSLVVAALHMRIDVWLLSVLAASNDVAHYALPARLTEGLLLPAGVASALVLPLTGRISGERERGQAALRYVGGIALLVAGGALVVMFFAAPVMRIAFGQRYESDAHVLRWLCLSASPAAIGIGLAPIVAILRRRAFLIVMSVALAVNVIANVVLVPAHQATGAAVAKLISTIVLVGGLVLIVLSFRPGPAASPPVGTARPTSA